MGARGACSCHSPRKRPQEGVLFDGAPRPAHHWSAPLPCAATAGVSWATRGRRGARPRIVANIATWWLVPGELEQLDGESWEEKLGMQEARGCWETSANEVTSPGRTVPLRPAARAGRGR